MININKCLFTIAFLFSGLLSAQSRQIKPENVQWPAIVRAVLIATDVKKEYTIHLFLNGHSGIVTIYNLKNKTQRYFIINKEGEIHEDPKLVDKETADGTKVLYQGKLYIRQKLGIYWGPQLPGYNPELSLDPKGKQ